jgi:streptogramin lyase
LQIPRLLFSSGDKRATTGRILLALFSIITSVALAWGLLAMAHSAAHADPTLLETHVPAINQSFGSEPWDLAFDNVGHVWVAEPQCDINISATPICSHTTQSGIAEYSRQGFTNGSRPVQIFVEPSGYSSPFFLAFDASWNLWFTEPVTNAIGELDTSYNWHQWAVPTGNASPLDLTFDQYGHLWFTEPSAGQIGEFDPTTRTFNEYPTPTSQSLPYGIAGPDPTTHSIWFTENSRSIHRIGRITPKADGTINGQIQEYLTNSSSSNGITPHLITFDNNGNIWWSEGYDRSIGRLVISQAVKGTNDGITEYVVPAPACPVPGSCGSHISGIAVDSKGTVWFDDSLSSRYGSFVPATSTFTLYVIDGCVTNNTHPHDGLAVDSNNNIWISEEFADKLAEALPGAITNPMPCSTPTIPPTAGSSPSPSPSPTPATGPVSKQWYFAEGRVGDGFKEWLTLGNPMNTPCQVTIQYLYTPDSRSAQTKTVSVKVPAATRVTEWVDGDLGTSPTGPGITDSALVRVDTNMTPSCPGIVAERPMYFTALGVSSGSDDLGVTHTAMHFSLADLAVGAQPGGGSYASFLAILNPPGGTAATVTATYYAAGQQVRVPAGTRGTIFPANASPRLPARVAVVLSASQPVVIERPTYFSTINGGNAGMVSGAADVVAVQSLANDCLFAEGYTGGQFQENFVLADLDPAHTVASVTIKLEYADGTTHSFPVTVNPQSQLLWNVNANGLGATSHDVSAEISATGARIVVEREMFFKYTHVANVGYDEWLTLQNPTGTPEAIRITLVNAKGSVYTFSFPVAGHSRATVDIVAVVIGHLYHSGDGYAGFEVSMAVQSSSGPCVAERPMYWNASGTQGGHDVIGYSGG